MMNEIYLRNVEYRLIFIFFQFLLPTIFSHRSQILLVLNCDDFYGIYTIDQPSSD